MSCSKKHHIHSTRVAYVDCIPPHPLAPCTPSMGASSLEVGSAAGAGPREDAVSARRTRVDLCIRLLVLDLLLQWYHERSQRQLLASKFCGKRRGTWHRRSALSVDWSQRRSAAVRRNVPQETDCCVGSLSRAPAAPGQRPRQSAQASSNRQ